MDGLPLPITPSLTSLYYQQLTQPFLPAATVSMPAGVVREAVMGEMWGYGTTAPYWNYR